MKDSPVIITTSFGVRAVRLVYLIPLFVFAVFLGFLLELIAVEKLNLVIKIPLVVYDYDSPQPEKSHTAPFSSSSEIIPVESKANLSIWEEASLLNISDFKWLRNNESICQPGRDSDNIDIFPVLVHSARSHFSERLTIRNSWGSLLLYKNWSIRFVFLIGEADRGLEPSRNEKQFKKEQALLEKEQSIFGDIVEGNFIDSYRNLTYKHMMGYKWILKFCSNAEFIMKVDDDMFVDIKRFLDWRREDLSTTSTEKNVTPPDLYCNTFRGTKPQRCIGCKWYASESEWPQDSYPDYCSGWCYALTVEMVRRLYSVVNQVKFFWVDDVFATGVLLEETKRTQVGFQPKIKHLWGEVRSLDFRSFRLVCEQKNMTMKRDFKTVVPIGKGSNFEKDMMCLWNKTLYDEHHQNKKSKDE